MTSPPRSRSPPPPFVEAAAGNPPIMQATDVESLNRLAALKWYDVSTDDEVPRIPELTAVDTDVEVRFLGVELADDPDRLKEDQNRQVAAAVKKLYEYNEEEFEGIWDEDAAPIDEVLHDVEDENDPTSESATAAAYAVFLWAYSQGYPDELLPQVFEAELVSLYTAATAERVHS